MKTIILNGDQLIGGSLYRDGTVLEVSDSFPDSMVKKVIKTEKEVENAPTE